jgi:hypothetical protein
MTEQEQLDLLDRASQGHINSPLGRLEHYRLILQTPCFTSTAEGSFGCYARLCNKTVLKAFLGK